MLEWHLLVAVQVVALAAIVTGVVLFVRHRLTKARRARATK